nr:hypothetical protein BaRGS_014341 [Batillaria attramentaria]
MTSLLAIEFDANIFHNPLSGKLSGFKFIFSFHNQSALPQRLPDGKWNCSVPHWADFQQHFLCDGYCMPVYVRCNDVYDCPGKEDEAACDSYTCPGVLNTTTN